MKKSKFTVVLPSNSNPTLFPNNEPNQFSVEFMNPIYLSGQYEVALVEMTYKNEVMTLKHSFRIFALKTKDEIFHLMNNKYVGYWAFNPLKLKPLKMDKQTGYNPKKIWEVFRVLNNIMFVNTIEKKGKGKGVFYYTNVKVFKPDVLVVLSNDLTKMFNFSNSCFTSKFEELSLNMKRKHHVKDWSVDLIPLYALQYKRIILKSKGELMTLEKFSERWKKHIPSKYIEIIPVETRRGLFNIRKVSPLNAEDWCILQLEDMFDADMNSDRPSFLARSGDEVQLSTTDVTFSEANRDHEWAVRVYEKRLNPAVITNEEEELDEVRISLPTIDSVNQLLDVLNVKSSEFGYKFDYSPSVDRIMLSIPPFHRIQLDDILQSVLGFVGQRSLSDSKQTASMSPMLKRDINSLFIYCNIVSYIHVGDTEAPLLRQLPLSSKENVVVDREFINKIYIPVNCNVLNKIDVSIHDQSGELIPFKDGLTTLTLEFRPME